jgi:methionyl aminopeptidase
MDSEEIKKFREAGRIAATALQLGGKMIKPGVKLLDVCDAVEKKILDMGAGIAFPTQTSRNEIAAHYCPDDEDESVYQEGDVVKLDCGSHVDGYVADTALTIDLGDNSNLIKASREAVEAAVKIAKVGTTIGEIGRTIQEKIEKYGFAPVRNLSGHGIGRYIIHRDPSITNFDSGNSRELEEGESIAIEPFASTGAGMIYESNNPTVFMISGRKPVRSPFARDVLKEIEQYQGLPFTTRWISRKLGLGKTRVGLRELMHAGIIRGYPPLPDAKKGLVSQAEHSVLVFDKPIVTTKLDE